jgi:hypothetical protein
MWSAHRKQEPHRRERELTSPLGNRARRCRARSQKSLIILFFLSLSLCVERQLVTLHSVYLFIMLLRLVPDFYSRSGFWLDLWTLICNRWLTYDGIFCSDMLFPQGDNSLYTKSSLCHRGHTKSIQRMIDLVAAIKIFKALNKIKDLSHHQQSCKILKSHISNGISAWKDYNHLSFDYD